MTRVVNEAQAALQVLPRAPIIYQRIRHLVILARGTKPPKWLHRPQDMPVILDASAARLTELASQAAQFWKYDKRAEEWQLALPPKWVIETLCSRTAWPFPVLEGIVASPTLRPDGSVLDVPGYDADDWPVPGHQRDDLSATAQHARRSMMPAVPSAHCKRP